MKRLDRKTQLTRKTLKTAKGFSLTEILIVLTVSSLVVVAALRIYNRVRISAGKINKILNKEDIAGEILQRIAEDIDRLAVSEIETTVTVANKLQSGFSKSQLVIESKFYDENNKIQTFEKVTWQSDYDVELDTTVLYRSHAGLAVEDKMYIEETEIVKGYNKDKGLYVPLCWGMTFFEIVVPREDPELEPIKIWNSKTLPKMVQVSISFAEPQENFDGTFEVLPEDISTRNIAINRSRKIPFKFIKKDFSPDDPNDFMEENTDPNDLETTETSEETETEEIVEEEISR